MHIDKAELARMASSSEHYPEADKVEFCLCGRSNVGKSSFINTLINRKNLARTSGNPGKTQTLNFYLIEDEYYFVDVPGYGYAKVSKKQREEFGVMIEEYLTNRKNLKLVFLLVDFRHEPTQDDVLMYNYLKHFGIPVCIIATKKDKVGKTLVGRHTKIIKKKLDFDENDSFIEYSSETLDGKEETWNLINSLK